MTKTSLVILFIWIVLAILNIVSLFHVSTFLIWCNYLFGGLNGIMALALVPEFLRYVFKKKKEEETE